MYYFDEFEQRFNLSEQLPDYDIIATMSSLSIASKYVNLYVKGWPDNYLEYYDYALDRVYVEKFGSIDGTLLREALVKILIELGVDFDE